MTAAVSQPTDAVAIRAHGGDSLVEHVVLVLPDRDGRFFQTEIMLVFAQQIAGRVVEPLQAAVGVVGQHQVAVAVVGESLALRLIAQGRTTFIKRPIGSKLKEMTRWPLIDWARRPVSGSY
jgi:hypothetical protein